MDKQERTARFFKDNYPWPNFVENVIKNFVRISYRYGRFKFEKTNTRVDSYSNKNIRYKDVWY